MTLLKGFKIRTPYLLLLPGMAFLLTFFIFPLINLAQTSTQTPVGGGDTGQYEQTLRFQNYFDAFIENREQFGRSFLYATIATVLALLIAYPLAYAIAFKGGKYKNFMLVLVIAPFFTSFLLRTIAWKQILGEEGFVVQPLRTLGIISESTTLTSSAFAVVAGMTYNFLPFMTLPLYASIDRIDPRTLEASGDLYANGFTTFRKVTLPLSMPGVVAGTLLDLYSSSWRLRQRGNPRKPNDKDAWKCHRISLLPYRGLPNSSSALIYLDDFDSDSCDFLCS